MALNFNLLNPELPGQIATSVTRGYEGAQDRANVLEQREQQKRDRLAKIIQDGAKSIVATPGAYKSVFARVKQVAGVGANALVGAVGSNVPEPNAPGATRAAVNALAGAVAGC